MRLPTRPPLLTYLLTAWRMPEIPRMVTQSPWMGVHVAHASRRYGTA